MRERHTLTDRFDLGLFGRDEELTIEYYLYPAERPATAFEAPQPAEIVIRRVTWDGADITTALPTTTLKEIQDAVYQIAHS